jgi:hypothetical protein
MCTNTTVSDALPFLRKFRKKFASFENAVICVVTINRHPGLQCFLFEAHFALNRLGCGETMLMLHGNVARCCIIE